MAEVSAPECPGCGKRDVIELGGDSWLCLECRTEWSGNSVTLSDIATQLTTAIPAHRKEDIDDILNAGSAEEVLGPVAIDLIETEEGIYSVADPGHMREDWTGRFAKTHGGDIFLVLEEMPDGVLIGEDREGQSYTILKDKCTLQPEGAVDVTDDISEIGTGENEPIIPAILAIAGLALQVGLQAITEDDKAWFNAARIGWLPPPANDIPEVEQGIAYAIACLIHIFGIPKDEVEKLSANILLGASAGVDSEGQDTGE